MGGLVDFPEVKLVEEGCPFLEARAFEDVVGGTRAIFDSVNHVEVSTNNMDVVRGEEGLKRLELEHPEGREVARGEIKI
jgi:hypothetical protein